ncbi:MAG: phage tail protein [Nitrospirota bacterium]|nr:phage tail protein [Nitrospirota bacterium]
MSRLDDLWNEVEETAGEVGGYVVAPFTFLVVEPVKALVNWLVDIPESPNLEGAQFTVEGADLKIPVVYGAARVGGIIAFKGVSGASNEYLNLVLVLGEGEIDAVTGITIDDAPSTDLRFAGLVDTYVHTGADTQAADANLIAEGIGWTAAHQLNGTAYVYLRLKWSGDAFRGMPRFTFDVHGRKVFDPRSGLTAWSDNPALCVRDYLTNGRFGRGLPDTAIDDAAVIAAANACDTTITAYTGGPVIPRFRCNGVVDTNRKVLENVRSLLTSCRGMLTFSGGRYRLRVEQDEAPVFTFTEDNIIGGWSIEGTAKSARLNRAKIRFLNPQRNWKGDLAIQESAAWLAADNGLRLERDVTLSFETDPYRADYHAQTILKKSREGITCAFLATIEALQVEAGDVVAVTHTTPGWISKAFRVQQITLREDGNVAVQLQEHDPTAYDRTVPAGLPAPPDTNLPDPFTVQPPTAVTVESGTAHLITMGDGTVVSRAYVSWTASADAYVDHYEVQAKNTAAPDWSAGAPVITSETAAHVYLVEDGVNYDFRVRAVNTAGVRSPWAVVVGHLVLGKQQVPDTPTGLVYATTAAGRRRLTWTMPQVTPDIAGFQLRYFAGGVGDWQSATDLSHGLVPVDPEVVPPAGEYAFEFDHLPAGQYTFYVRPWDTSGLTSVAPASVGPVTLPAPPVTSADWSQVTGTGRPEDYAASRDSNLIPDPNFRDKVQRGFGQGYWVDHANGVYSATSGESGTPGLTVNATGQNNYVGGNLDFPVEPGEILFVRVRYQATAGFNGTADVAALCYNHDRSLFEAIAATGAFDASIPGVWTTFSGTLTIPVGLPIARAGFHLRVLADATVGQLLVSNLYVSRADAGADVTQSVIDTGILTTGAVWMNSGTFGQAGVQVEYNNGTPRLYVGDGVNSFLRHDGTLFTWKAANTELDAAGNLTAINATFDNATVTNATVSGAITVGAGSSGIANLADAGAFATLDQINSANIGSYIADLSVDTLQIADNAVTVPYSAYLDINGDLAALTVDAWQTGVSIVADLTDNTTLYTLSGIMAGNPALAAATEQVLEFSLGHYVRWKNSWVPGVPTSTAMLVPSRWFRAYWGDSLSFRDVRRYVGPWKPNMTVNEWQFSLPHSVDAVSESPYNAFLVGGIVYAVTSVPWFGADTGPTEPNWATAGYLGAYLTLNNVTYQNWGPISGIELISYCNWRKRMTTGGYFSSILLTSTTLRK